MSLPPQPHPGLRALLSLSPKAQSWGGEGRNCPESNWWRGAPDPPPTHGGNIQSWLCLKGPPSLPATRSLCPAQLSPAPLSGVRARAEVGRGVSYRIWGDGVSLPQLHKLKRAVLKGPALFLQELELQSKCPPVSGCQAWRGAQLPQAPRPLPSCQAA